MPDGRICIIKDSSLPESSKAFQVFENILYEVVGIDREKVTYCMISPSLSLKDIQADVIIVVGEKVLNQVCNLRGITKYTGRVIEGMIPVVPIVSPGFLEHNPNYLMKYAEDIQVAYHVSIGIARTEATNQYKMVEDFNTLKELISYIKQSGYCSFDFETTELTDMSTFDPDFYPTCLSLSFQQGSSYVIPLYHEENMFTDRLIEMIMKELEEHVFGNPDVTKVGQNIKFDMHVLAWLGVVNFRGPYHDVMLLHQLYDENASHKLKDIVRDFYPKFANYEKDLGTKNWAKIPLKTLAKYNALDSDLTLRLYWQFTDMHLDKDDGRIYQMFRNLTAPATKVLFFMEENGMLIDKAFLTESIRQVDGYIAEQEKAMHSHPEVRRFEEFKTTIFRQARIDELQKKHDEGLKAEYKSKQAQENQIKRTTEYLSEIQKLKTGLIDIEPYTVNFSSPAQLKELFFTKEGFNFDVPKNNYKLPEESTGADNLSLIKDKTGFIDELQIYRQLNKISGTYLTSILEKLDSNHYIHTNFNQQVTKTGRLSSNKPNLQNIISRTKYKIIEESVALVKKSFIPPKGYTLVQADYSQMELRIMAHFAEESNMLKAYNDKQDLHEITAANSRGYTLEEFQKLKETDPKEYKKLRFEAKAENFGFCLHPDTDIVTNKGIISIKDVVIGDMVLTHKNRWEPVLQKQQLQSKYLYEITTTTGKIVKCTPDHMWLCVFPQANGNPSMSGWVEAQDLKENMFLSYNSNGYTQGEMHIDVNIARLIGWFLSEGSFSGSNFKISQSRKANPDVCAKMDSTLIPMGFQYKTYPKENNFYRCSMQFYKDALEDIMDFRLKSHEKNFTCLRHLLDRESMLELLGALWDGDGCITFRERKSVIAQIQYTSISMQLLKDIQYCLHSLGINSKIYSYPNQRCNIIHILGKGSTNKFLSVIPTVKVNRNKKELTVDLRNWGCEEKIVSIKKIIYNNDVYDITVANDHSFVANNVFTHNCYGMSSEGFKEYARTDYGLTISLREAEKKREAFFKKYPKLNNYYKEYINKARKFGYVRTFFGRRIHLPEITSINGGKRGHAERNAINGPIQGTAGEMTILALSLLYNRLDPRIIMTNTIHDSIIFYIPDEILDESFIAIRQTMEKLPLQEYFGKSIDNIPIQVDFETSKISWKDLNS